MHLAHTRRVCFRLSLSLSWFLFGGEERNAGSEMARGVVEDGDAREWAERSMHSKQITQNLSISASSLSSSRRLSSLNRDLVHPPPAPALDERSKSL